MIAAGLIIVLTFVAFWVRIRELEKDLARLRRQLEIK